MSRPKSAAKLAAAGLLLLAAATVRPSQPYGLNDAGMTLITFPGRVLGGVYEPLGERLPLAMGPQASAAPLTSAALSGDRLSVVALDVPALPQLVPFDHQPVPSPRVREFRSRHALGALVQDCSSDLEVFATLSTWTKSRWVNSPTLSGPTLHVADALRLLDAAAGGERFYCAQYSYVLIQALVAVGYTARCLRLESPKGGLHSVVEAWSDDDQRWIVLDPTWDAHYVRDGVPLSARELREARERKQSVQVVSGPRIAYSSGEVFDPKASTQPGSSLDLFTTIAVCRRNDFLERAYPRWHPAYFGNRWQGLWVEASVALDRPLNLTSLSLVRRTGEVLELRLATRTPNFSSFEFRVDQGPWTGTPATLRWRLHPGRNRLAVRARNTSRRTGRPARVAIDLGP